MWPFTGGIESVWLALYLLTFALHAVFVSFVAAGSAYALVQAVRRADDPLAARVRDWLPFMLGAGITAGVAPLLFIQLLYQRRFYTANLIMGPRWGAVVPALVVGFYALYLAKAAVTLRWRRIALAVGVACFLFVAWSWTELHLLMQADAAWRVMYAAGERVYVDGALSPRLMLWLGVMLVLFATVIAWSASAAERKRIAVLALGGLIAAGLAADWMVARGAEIDLAHGWLILLGLGAVVTVVAWGWVYRSPEGPGLAVATGGVTAALLAGTVVREAPRLALFEPERASALDAGGFAVFAVTLVIGIAAIAWIVRLVRTVPPAE